MDGEHDDGQGAVYELFALRYGIGRARTAAANFIPVPGFEPPATDPSLACYAWVARSAERVVLVDTGCDETTATSRGIAFERLPQDSLRRLDIAPEDVTDVVLTHLHWDHAGTLDRLPGARVHLHPAEIAHATGPAMGHAFLRRPYAPHQLATVLELVHGERVAFTGATTEVAPGLTVHHVGGHTPGMQVVRVPTRRGPVVLAGDARHYDANADTGVPFPVLVDVEAYCHAGATVERLAASPEHVVAGHEPAITRRYPRVDPDDELVVRLDVAPTPVGAR
jgi:glyoxylase-like metal-dependent hydrolase (beta-lactamase superfamily II)